MKSSVPTKEELKQKLTKEQWKVTQQDGTQYPFHNIYHDNKKQGTYNCICCDSPLFSSKHKFDSGSGWPSFFKQLIKGNVKENKDVSHGMVRVAVNCAICGAHLGHVFDDGPKQETGLRYCINSASLNFIEGKL